MALVYIVEDDINIREIESFSLKNSGYTVEEFEDTKKFWKLMVLVTELKSKVTNQ